MSRSIEVRSASWMPSAWRLDAGTLILGYAVALSTGSRALGGVVLAIGGIWCIWAWMQRHGARTAKLLGAVGFGAFVASHLIGLLIGAWPSVILVAGVVAVSVWKRADSQTVERRSLHG
jgi:hypothetical protein